MNVQKYIKGNEGLVLKAALIGAGYLFVVRPLLKSIGVIETAEDRERKRTEQQNATGNGPFNPNYYKSRPVTELVTKASADAFAKKLHDAIGYIWDDEGEVYGVFRQMKYKATVSWVAERFYATYGEDLYSYLSRNMNSDEMAQVNGIVNNLL
jgi:hypothetical protein